MMNVPTPRKNPLRPRGREEDKPVYSPEHFPLLTGTMEVLTDSASKEMIWRDGDTMYYPGGVTDPDYCVLKFTASQGRFYSSFKSENFDIPTYAGEAE